VAMALALTRRIPQLDLAVKRESWANTMAVAGPVRRPDVQTFGLLGLGRIGRRVAEMAAVIGFRVQAFDPAVKEGDEVAEGVRLVSFDELVASSDVLSLHVPLLESTRHIVDAGVLARMPEGAVLLNVSRGGLVDEEALVEALRSGRLAGAGLDAFAHEPLEPGSVLRGLDSVILTPHAGHWSEDSWAETRRKAFDDVTAVLSGREPRYPVG
jgi:D-3-phosphoglycerate dehydrogenase / 2-oxoglutarate reductase